MSSCNFGNLKLKRHFNQEEYEEVYSRLKSKYAKKLIENWTECTDPYKFVFEDIGIATYLLLLWKDKVPSRFVDMGCGNGLLVYILTGEGHLGEGIDVRKRKIWDTYPDTVKLVEETIIPSNRSRYPEADWLIGNHSDELTVWLPIMAARSNTNCQFITIPCCPYKLNGAKFQRRKTQISVYQDFLEYVQEIGELCGFDITAEKLRIPSTKRTCLIGWKKSGDDPVALAAEEQAICDLIREECPGGGVNINGVEHWIQDYQAREAIEPVRNCSQIPRDIQQEILKEVLVYLLSQPRQETLSDGRHWNRGEVVDISQIAQIISPKLIQRLRSECKGLQTLLKNHHQVFEIKHGKVTLRSTESQRVNSETVRKCKDFKWKQKACWFHDNHPDGCPLVPEDCSYAHNTKGPNPFTPSASKPLPMPRTKRPAPSQAAQDAAAQNTVEAKTKETWRKLTESGTLDQVTKKPARSEAVQDVAVMDAFPQSTVDAKSNALSQAAQDAAAKNKVEAKTKDTRRKLAENGTLDYVTKKSARSQAVQDVAVMEAFPQSTVDSKSKEMWRKVTESGTLDHVFSSSFVDILSVGMSGRQSSETPETKEHKPGGRAMAAEFSGSIHQAAEQMAQNLNLQEEDDSIVEFGGIGGNIATMRKIVQWVNRTFNTRMSFTQVTTSSFKLHTDNTSQSILSEKVPLPIKPVNKDIIASIGRGVLIPHACTEGRSLVITMRRKGFDKESLVKLTQENPEMPLEGVIRAILSGQEGWRQNYRFFDFKKIKYL